MVEKESRLIYEVRPIGDFLMIRPATKGQEHLIQRMSFIEFNRAFDPFLAQFFIPELLTDEDAQEVTY